MSVQKAGLNPLIPKAAPRHSRKPLIYWRFFYVCTKSRFKSSNTQSSSATLKEATDLLAVFYVCTKAGSNPLIPKVAPRH